MVEEETVPESDSTPSPAQGGAHELLALVVAWSRDEAWRLGQSLLIPPGDPGPVIAFGRGPIDSTDCRKRLLEEHRCVRSTPQPPLASASISRMQLEIRAAGEDDISVRNVGRCPLLRNGIPTQEARFERGDTLQLGRQLLFVVAKRPVPSVETRADYPEFPFGAADSNGIVGESGSAWRLRGHIASVAARTGHVLISGPSGSGKELVAQGIHALSKRSGRRLISRSAATIPESLMDAELFGNCKNYPNAGMAERPGLVGEANGSNLFLDEIAELPIACQARLLRLLDSGEYHRLGEATARRADLRLIAATNRDVDSLKHDLLARMTLRIEVPSLSERVEDIPLLVRHIARSAAANGDALARSILQGDAAAGALTLGIDFVRRLLEHRYELGMRELETILWRQLTSPELMLQPEVWPEEVNRLSLSPPHQLSFQSSKSAKPDQLTAALIQRCLDDNNGSVELTWRALGMKNRYLLIRAIKKYELEIRRRPGRGRSAS